MPVRTRRQTGALQRANQNQQNDRIFFDNIQKVETQFDEFISKYLFLNPQFDNPRLLESKVLDIILNKIHPTTNQNIKQQLRTTFLRLFYLIRDMTIQYMQYKDSNLQRALKEQFENAHFNRNMLNTHNQQIYMCTALMKKLGIKVLYQTIQLFRRYILKPSEQIITNVETIYNKYILREGNLVAAKVENAYFGKNYSPFLYSLYSQIDKTKMTTPMIQITKKLFFLHMMTSMPINNILFENLIRPEIIEKIGTYPIIPSQQAFFSKEISSIIAKKWEQVLMEVAPGIEKADFSRVDQWFEKGYFTKIIEGLYGDTRNVYMQQRLMISKAEHLNILRDNVLDIERVQYILNPFGTFLVQVQPIKEQMEQKGGGPTLRQGQDDYSLTAAGSRLPPPSIKSKPHPPSQQKRVTFKLPQRTNRIESQLSRKEFDRRRDAVGAVLSGASSKGSSRTFGMQQPPPRVVEETNVRPVAAPSVPQAAAPPVPQAAAPQAIDKEPIKIVEEPKFSKIGIHTIIRGFIQKLINSPSVITIEELRKIYTLCCKLFAYGFVMSYGYRALYLFNSFFTIQDKTALLQNEYTSNMIYSELEKSYVNPLLIGSIMRETSEGKTIYEFKDEVFIIDGKAYEPTNGTEHHILYQPINPIERSMSSLGVQIRLPTNIRTQLTNYLKLDQLLFWRLNDGLDVRQGRDRPNYGQILKLVEPNKYTSGDTIINLLSMTSQDIQGFDDIKDCGFGDNYETVGLKPASSLASFDEPYGIDMAEVMRPEFYGDIKYVSKFMDAFYRMDDVIYLRTSINVPLSLNEALDISLKINEAIKTIQSSLQPQKDADCPVSLTVDADDDGINEMRGGARADSINIQGVQFNSERETIQFIKEILFSSDNLLIKQYVQSIRNLKGKYDSVQSIQRLKNMNMNDKLIIHNFLQNKINILQKISNQIKDRLHQVIHILKHQRPTFNNF